MYKHLANGGATQRLRFYSNRTKDHSVTGKTLSSSRLSAYGSAKSGEDDKEKKLCVQIALCVEQMGSNPEDRTDDC
jgi:hypothetical protein